MNPTRDVIFYNARIFTSNPKQPEATAMVVRDGRIVWVGEEAGLQGWTGKRMNLQGRRVLPGLIDAHMHPLFLADAARQIPCTPPLIHSIEDLVTEIRRQRQSGGADAWIKAWGYDEGKWSEGRAPTRWDLDRAAPDVPVIVYRTCSHMAVVNSVALAIAGISKETPDPLGGEIVRDSDGEPTGLLRENAKALVTPFIPVQTMEESATALAELSPQLLGHGITAITDLMARREPEDDLDLYRKARERGLQPRTVLYYLWEHLRKRPVIDPSIRSRQSPVHVGGIKLFADGSISGRTAWIDPVYRGNEVTGGMATTSREELLAAAEAAKENQVQLVIHGMGNRAIDMIVDTFRGTKGWLADMPSIRIEHAALPFPKAIQGAVETGIAFVFQPIFLFAEIESYLHNIGRERTRGAYPVQTMLERGGSVAFSSDAPATTWADPVNPFVGIQAAVTRKAYDGTDIGGDQAVDVATAITLYTRAAQQITGIPAVGQLAPGYHGDFIVLDQDIFEVEKEKIHQIRVEETYMGGLQVYQRGVEVKK